MKKIILRMLVVSSISAFADTMLSVSAFANVSKPANQEHPFPKHISQFDTSDSMVSVKILRVGFLEEMGPVVLRLCSSEGTPQDNYSTMLGLVTTYIDGQKISETSTSTALGGAGEYIGPKDEKAVSCQDITYSSAADLEKRDIQITGVSTLGGTRGYLVEVYSAAHPEFKVTKEARVSERGSTVGFSSLQAYVIH